MIKLHLGCGKLKLPNFINIDIEHENADMKLDINNLSIFNNNSVNEIYNCHVLEHVKRRQILHTIIEWNRILKKDGVLRIAVPDFKSIMQIYQKNNDISQLIGLLNGGQRDDYDIHYVNFDIETLTEILETCGFGYIEIYNPNEFLGEFDDYSKCYLPHMDSENGVLMSLNIKCKKMKDMKYDDIEISEKLKKFCKA